MFRPLLVSVLAAIPLLAQADISFRDPEDGAFDTSDYLLNHRGFLPVPVVITEPAIGYGGGAMLLFFSESIVDIGEQSARDGSKMHPPNITGIGGAMTENGTWGATLMHFRTWDGDRYRYFGFGGKINLETDYYGPFGRPNAYTLNGFGVVQQLLMRLGDSNWYVGPRLTYLDADTRFDGHLADELGLADRNRRIGKLGLVIDYDSRDNIFYPNKGVYAELQAQSAQNWLGSTQEFDQYALRTYTWIPVAERWNVGLRLEGETTTGDVPFYAEPSVSLRGVANGRYQNESVMTGEAEIRYALTPRWSLLGFGGVGRAWGRRIDFSSADDAWAAGAGFRYLIARKLGMTFGMDFATSQYDNAFYFQAGSAWR
ncbi:BamA/TamA family outer membrane protein [Chitinibacteraceae bacterium HSL-7]